MLVRYPDFSYMKRKFVTANSDEGKVFAGVSRVIAVGKKAERRQK
jgi:hypothetical protein